MCNNNNNNNNIEYSRMQIGHLQGCGALRLISKTGIIFIIKQKVSTI